MCKQTHSNIYATLTCVDYTNTAKWTYLAVNHDTCIIFAIKFIFVPKPIHVM